MIRRLRLSLQQQASRRRIRFNQLKANLCPICNNIVYYDTREKLFKCKKEDCPYREEKIEFNLDYDVYGMD